MRGISTVACGGRMTGAIGKDGVRWGWGDNRYGQLGDGTTEYPEGPTKVTGMKMQKLAMGWEHIMGLTPAGVLYTWGANDAGQLGDGTTTERTSPVRILSGVKDMAAFDFTSFAILSDGTLYGWGRNDHGQLGDGTTTDKQRPVKLRSNISKVAAGGSFTMFLTTNGDLLVTGTIK